MTDTAAATFNLKLDLRLERTIDSAPEFLWKGWTDAATLKQWFCPRPWKVVEASIDLKPGGKFLTVFESPEGQKYPNEGCYLEIIPNRKLVYTNTLKAGYLPSTFNETEFPLTVILELMPEGGKTKYRATVRHATEAARNQHDAMGFESGWSAALDQLLELRK